MTKRIFVKSFGCQMNEYDSNRIHDAMAEIGYEAGDDIDTADVVVLNTCHIREKAAEKVYSELGRIKQVRNRRLGDGGDMVIVVAGCMAQAEGREILARAPYVSIVVGPQSYHRLPQYVFSAQQHRQRIVDTEFPAESKFDQLPAPAKSPLSAFLTVQEGCDKFCTFCVVPYTRGGEFSRPVADILREAGDLVAKGAREIMLLGQNVNAYHGSDADGGSVSLAGLIGRLAAIDGLARLRFTTSHPNDMSDELIAAHLNVAKLMPYLHLPLQAGSDRILAAMNRKHTAANYRQLAARIRASRPDIALSTDIIVGFPGETDADFAATMSVVGEVGYAQAFSFKYSARPGTPAAELADQVPEAVKDSRLQELQEVLRQQQLAFNRSLVGTRQKVLLEGHGRLAGQLVGRSPYLQPVHVMAPADLVGQIVEVDIVDATRNSLTGDIYSEHKDLRTVGGAAE